MARRRKASAREIIAGAALASCAYLVWRFGWWILAAFGIFAVAWLFSWWAKSRPPAQKELRTDLPHDVFGPIFSTPRDAQRFYNQLGREYPALAVRLRLQQILRESLHIALTSSKAKTIDSRMETAREMWQTLRLEHDIPDEERQPMAALVAAVEAQFPETRALNIARGSLEHAAKLKTPKARERHVEAAREVLRAALQQLGSDAALVRAALKRIDAGDLSIPGPDAVFLSRNRNGPLTGPQSP
jgi:hypothetical protein